MDYKFEYHVMANGISRFYSPTDTIESALSTNAMTYAIEVKVPSDKSELHPVRLIDNLGIEINEIVFQSWRLRYKAFPFNTVNYCNLEYTIYDTHNISRTYITFANQNGIKSSWDKFNELIKHNCFDEFGDALKIRNLQIEVDRLKTDKLQIEQSLKEAINISSELGAIKLSHIDVLDTVKDLKKENKMLKDKLTKIRKAVNSK